MSRFGAWTSQKTTETVDGLFVELKDLIQRGRDRNRVGIRGMKIGSWTDEIFENVV